MPLSPDKINTLNFPIETEEARKFWASDHKCNTMMAIIAFSLDFDNANDNLRRYGYKYFWRKKALAVFGAYTNHPSMEGMLFHEPHIPYWHCMPAGQPQFEWLCTEDGEALCTEDYMPLMTEETMRLVRYIMTEDFYYILTEDGQQLHME